MFSDDEALAKAFKESIAEAKDGVSETPSKKGKKKKKKKKKHLATGEGVSAGEGGGGWDGLGGECSKTKTVKPAGDATLAQEGERGQHKKTKKAKKKKKRLLSQADQGGGGGGGGGEGYGDGANKRPHVVESPEFRPPLPSPDYAIVVRRRCQAPVDPRTVPEEAGAAGGDTSPGFDIADTDPASFHHVYGDAPLPQFRPVVARGAKPSVSASQEQKTPTSVSAVEVATTSTSTSTSTTSAAGSKKSESKKRKLEDNSDAPPQRAHLTESKKRAKEDGTEKRHRQRGSDSDDRKEDPKKPKLDDSKKPKLDEASKKDNPKKPKLNEEGIQGTQRKEEVSKPKKLKQSGEGEGKGDSESEHGLGDAGRKRKRQSADQGDGAKRKRVGGDFGSGAGNEVKRQGAVRQAGVADKGGKKRRKRNKQPRNYLRLRVFSK